MHDSATPSREVVIYEEPQEEIPVQTEEGPEGELLPALRGDLTKRTRALLAYTGNPSEDELTKHLQDLVRENRGLQFELGCLIVHGQGRHWYEDYSGKWRSMEQWALYTIGDAALIRSAVAMYHTAVVLQKSRIDVMELVDTFSLTKAKAIMYEDRDANRQAKTEAENIPGYGSLPPKEQKARKNEIMDRNRPTIAANMRAILQTPDKDIEYNQKIRDGRPIHIPVYITGMHVTKAGRLIGQHEVDLRALSSLEQESLIKGDYYLQLFDTQGHPTSYKKFLEDYIGDGPGEDEDEEATYWEDAEDDLD